MKEQTDRLAALLRESENTVFFGGAGVSTESGIPDFRSKSGLYKARQVYGYPGVPGKSEGLFGVETPEQLLSHTFFERHTELFFRYYRENLIARDAQPNAAHRALARLEQSGKLQAVITQNIDGLHQTAGRAPAVRLLALRLLTQGPA